MILHDCMTVFPKFVGTGC